MLHGKKRAEALGAIATLIRLGGWTQEEVERAIWEDEQDRDEEVPSALEAIESAHEHLSDEDRAQLVEVRAELDRCGCEESQKLREQLRALEVKREALLTELADTKSGLDDVAAVTEQLAEARAQLSEMHGAPRMLPALAADLAQLVDTIRAEFRREVADEPPIRVAIRMLRMKRVLESAAVNDAIAFLREIGMRADGRTTEVLTLEEGQRAHDLARRLAEPTS